MQFTPLPSNTFTQNSAPLTPYYPSSHSTISPPPNNLQSTGAANIANSSSSSNLAANNVGSSNPYDQSARKRIAPLNGKQRHQRSVMSTTAGIHAAIEAMRYGANPDHA